MTLGESPGTSEMRRLTSSAGWAAAARRPPLIADRCFLTVFISPISAPEDRSARLTACLSASVRPSAGSASSAEAPPEISAMTRSSGPALLASARIRSAASRPRASGTGCEASTISMLRQGTPWPVRVTTSPSSGPGQWSSTAFAIAADALPAPMTMVRPFGGFGRWAGTTLSGSAAATAASNMARSSIRVSSRVMR